MAIEYVNTEEAMKRSGLRMIVVGNVPSLWGEAAKGILHIKRIPWVAVRLAYDDEPMKAWTGGQRNGPIAFYDDEKPRSGWAEILLLAERIAPAPALVPRDPAERALLFGYAHEICGEGGLGWARRLQLIHAGLQGAGGFHARVSTYLGKKYGYHGPEAGAAASDRVVELLGMLAARLKAQRASGSRYYLGSNVTALDVYSAAALGMFRPLPDDQCPMDPATRAAFETLDARTEAALDPLLLEHRAMMYAEHLALPLSL
jgi:glutathione S-transferase